MRASDEPMFIPRLAERARTQIADRDCTFDLSALASKTCLAAAGALAGLSVLIATRTQITSAAAMVELDGLARRIVIAPPDLNVDHLTAITEDAEIEAIATDDPARFAETAGQTVVAITMSPELAPRQRADTLDTEWVMLTSGTSGRPKMVSHSLSALAGAITGAPPGQGKATWATFYDIRRYGGLQIFLRALLGGTDLVVGSEGELIGDLLHRLATSGVAAISGTPSHWRRVLMSGERGAFKPEYIRLSGEIADQLVLDGLRDAFPGAAIAHAYASTEAGVGFSVDDGLEGFPASFLDTEAGDPTMRIVDGTLRIRSRRAASGYLGRGAPPLAAADGFIDSGDLVEQRGNRCYFVGRRGGIINVGGLKVNPEEVEAALNSHKAVRMSLVQARKNPLTGAIVIADIVLRHPEQAGEDLKQDILQACRTRLDRHKVPAFLRFVPTLALTPGGKLSRPGG